MSAREVAEQIAGHAWHWSQAEFVAAIEAALVAERERAARIAEVHRHSAPCDGAGCKTVIAAAIRVEEEG